MMPRQAIRPAGGEGKHLFANFPGQKPDFKRLYNCAVPVPVTRDATECIHPLERRANTIFKDEK